MIPAGVLLFVRSYWRQIAYVVMALAVVGFVWGRIIQYGKQRYQAGADAVTVRWERDKVAWAEERAKAAALAEAEARRRRQLEQEAADAMETMRAESLAALAAEQRLRGDSDAARQRLLGYIAAYARAGGVNPAAPDSCRATVARAETLGLLVAERDDLAGQCEREAERIGRLLRTCISHAEITERMFSREAINGSQ